RVLPESPIRVEYELTSKGSALQKALHEIGAWAEKWIPANASATDTDTAASVSEGRSRTRRTRTA
ncbi:MAG TPA: winged helix-turn-helix transcriptional regulator, partial [Gemmatimonadaceae bacterium]|nr:winged helix-turn-helix transcriptional regulator [Gemmatimonadaceae bacterium]